MLGEGFHGGVWECPDLFQLPILNPDDETATIGDEAWVLIVSVGPGEGFSEGSRTQYFIGNFDGLTFNNVNPPNIVFWLDYGRDNYAGVSYTGIPPEDGRCIIQSWMSNWMYANLVPTNPWRGAMTIPRVLSLWRAQAGVRLFQQPVRELERLRTGIAVSHDFRLSSQATTFENLPVRFDFLVDFSWSPGSFPGVIEVSLQTDTSGGAITIRFYPDDGKFSIDRSKSGLVGFHAFFPGACEAPLQSSGNTFSMRMLVDTSSIELFVNDGASVVTDLFLPRSRCRSLSFRSAETNMPQNVLAVYARLVPYPIADSNRALR